MRSTKGYHAVRYLPPKQMLTGSNSTVANTPGPPTHRGLGSTAPKFLAFSRFARTNRFVQGRTEGALVLFRPALACLCEAKKTKWQNVAMALAAHVSSSAAAGHRNDTTVPGGSTASIRSGDTVRHTTSAVSGSRDFTRADRPRMSGMNKLSQARQPPTDLRGGRAEARNLPRPGAALARRDDGYPEDGIKKPRLRFEVEIKRHAQRVILHGFRPFLWMRLDP